MTNEKEINEAVESSNKFNSLKTFKRRVPALFSIAEKEGVLYACCKAKLLPMREKISAPIIVSAQQYSSLNEWAKNDPINFVTALKQDVLNLCTEHMNKPVHRFTKRHLMTSLAGHSLFDTWAHNEPASLKYAEVESLLEEVQMIFDAASNDDSDVVNIRELVGNETTLKHIQKQHPDDYKKACQQGLKPKIVFLIRENRKYQQNEKQIIQNRLYQRQYKRRVIKKITDRAIGINKLSTFKIYNRKLYKEAEELGLIDFLKKIIDYNHLKKRIFDSIEDKYNITDWMRSEPDMYQIAVQEGFIEECKVVLQRQSRKKTKSKTIHTKADLIDAACKYENNDDWRMNDYVTFYKAKSRGLLKICEAARESKQIDKQNT